MRKAAGISVQVAARDIPSPVKEFAHSVLSRFIHNGSMTMIDHAKCSKKMMEILGLKFQPVAVKLIRQGEPIPGDVPQPEKNVRHCQSIMRARRGEVLLVPANKHACAVGASALGLMPVPEKVASGQFHFNLSMYGSEEAARHTLEIRPTFKEGSMAATLVGPLGKVEDPDVIIVTAIPEQIYWLMPAATTYDDGGRVTIETASFQACCADSTILPLTSGLPNLSLGCYGCRRQTDLAPEEMLMGFRADRLERMVEVLEILNEKAIPKCRGDYTR